MHYLEVELSSLVQSLEVWLSASQQRSRKKMKTGIVRDLHSVSESTDDSKINSLSLSAY